MARRVARGEVRLYRFAPPDKARPVLVLTRGSAIDYLSTVTVAPISTTIRDVPSEVRLGIEDGMKGPCAVNLHNVQTVHQRNLGGRLGSLTPATMDRVCRALAFSVGCDAAR